MEPKEICLRPPTKADVAALYSLHRAAYKEISTRAWGPWDEEWQANHFREHFDFGMRKIIQYGGADVGYIDVIEHADHIWLSEIVIAPDHQNRGIGNHLLNELI